MCCSFSCKNRIWWTITIRNKFFTHSQNNVVHQFEHHISYKLYPKVFSDYYQHVQLFSELWYLPTPAFFYGLKEREEILMNTSPGKSIIIKMIFKTDPDENGVSIVGFEMNGQPRRIEVVNKSAASVKKPNRKAEGKYEIGAPLPGKVVEIKVEEGDKVVKDGPLFVIEAMKMETIVTAAFDGEIKKIHLSVGELVELDDLVIELEIQN